MSTSDVSVLIEDIEVVNDTDREILSTTDKTLWFLYKSIAKFDPANITTQRSSLVSPAKLSGPNAMMGFRSACLRRRRCKT